MNQQRWILLCVGAALIALLGGCKTVGYVGQEDVVGTWTNSLGTVLMMDRDGKFYVDLNKDGKQDAWGTYKIAGNQITLQRTGGVKPRGCQGPGVYKYDRHGTVLSFSLVRDKCWLRRKNILTPWTLK